MINHLSSYVVAKLQISVRTKITEENVDQYFYNYDVDVAMLKGDCIRDKQELVGTIANRDMTSQEVVRDRFCTEEAGIYERYQEPIEASIEANGASGQIKCRPYDKRKGE